MFLAAEPLTTTSAGGRVVHVAAGAEVPGWGQLPYRVRVALLNHGSVYEAPDLAPDPAPPASDPEDTRGVPVAAPPADGLEAGDGAHVCVLCPGGVAFETRRSLGQHMRWAHRDAT